MPESACVTPKRVKVAEPLPLGFWCRIGAECPSLCRKMVPLFSWLLHQMVTLVPVPTLLPELMEILGGGNLGSVFKGETAMGRGPVGSAQGQSLSPVASPVTTSSTASLFSGVHSGSNTQY